MGPQRAPTPPPPAGGREGKSRGEGRGGTGRGRPALPRTGPLTLTSLALTPPAAAGCPCWGGGEAALSGAERETTEAGEAPSGSPWASAVAAAAGRAAGTSATGGLVYPPARVMGVPGAGQRGEALETVQINADSSSWWSK